MVCYSITIKSGPCATLFDRWRKFEWASHTNLWTCMHSVNLSLPLAIGSSSCSMHLRCRIPEVYISCAFAFIIITVYQEFPQNDKRIFYSCSMQVCHTVKYIELDKTKCIPTKTIFINVSNWSIFITAIKIRKFDNWTNNLM